jgi:hypothetical protein
MIITNRNVAGLAVVGWSAILSIAFFWRGREAQVLQICPAFVNMPPSPGFYCFILRNLIPAIMFCFGT